ncbi:MAG: septum formation protein Maf [Firmicutes bacterium]|mgnify:CR=1 FL=1|nr:septum formation protein Maf [Bacillota bacterium]
MKIILASASQRRINLLTKFGFDFQVHTAEVEEIDISRLEYTACEQIAVKNALHKAQAVLHKFPDALVIGADTIVVIGKRILGKPENADKAYEMLRLLSGKKHQVITGVALCSQKRIREFFVSTDVYLRKLADYEIHEYIKTKEPLDKAGSYGIQGIGGAFVESISGCYYNVVGLPISRLIVELRGFGIDIFARGGHEGE